MICDIIQKPVGAYLPFDTTLSYTMIDLKDNKETEPKTVQIDNSFACNLAHPTEGRS